MPADMNETQIALTNMPIEQLLSFYGKDHYLHSTEECFYTSQIAFCIAGPHRVSPSNLVVASKKSGY